MTSTICATGRRSQATSRSFPCTRLTPGYASEHLCYYLPEEQALFTGDLILGGSTTVVPDEDGHLGQYLDSVDTRHKAPI